MTDGGIFTPIIPEIDGAGVERVARLIAREKAAGIDSAALRRLAALLPPDSKVADLAGARLKLSNKARKRLVLSHDPAWADICKPAELAYRMDGKVRLTGCSWTPPVRLMRPLPYS